MPKSGKTLTPDSCLPKYGQKSLVSTEQNKIVKKNNITFSFSYFDQIPDFEIGCCSQKWHIGLVERLKALGKMAPEAFLEDKGSDALRFHRIDWNAKNIPIQRTSLSWLPKDILDNDDEFPIMQFSISTSTGRMIGYFDRETSVFNIVLLDPNHNIQPSKKTNYQIQPTTKGLSQYDDLLNKLDRIKKTAKKCPHNECILHEDISTIDELNQNIVYVGLDKDFNLSFQEILNKHSVQEIFEMGILSFT